MYVTLTGARNNAGDFLIRHSAHTLLARVRPDRPVHDLNSWEAIDGAKLETINAAKALILCGGPAIRRRMVAPQELIPYDLSPTTLSKIRVPIVTMGLGWNHKDGRWSAVAAAIPTPDTRHLLSRIRADGLNNSVRDIEAARFLDGEGVDRVAVTGCPALFIDEALNGQPLASTNAGRVVVSAGVLGRREGTDFEQQFRDVVGLACRSFGLENVLVAFHHATTAAGYAAAYGDGATVADRAMVGWVADRGIEWCDLSGSSQGMIDLYANCLLHIGFRVHAHLLCTSLRRPSILLAEDSRGFGAGRLLGGWVIPAIEPLAAATPPAEASQEASKGLDHMLREAVGSFLANDLSLFRAPWDRVSLLRNRMMAFLRSLP